MYGTTTSIRPLGHFVNVSHYSCWLAFILLFLLCSFLLFYFFFTLSEKLNDNTMSVAIAPNRVRYIKSSIGVTSLAIAANDVNLAHSISSKSFNSTRFVVLVICLFGISNYFVYNAGIISFIMVQTYETPIHELLDFLCKSNYHLLVIGGTSYET